MLTAGCYAPVDIPPPHPHPGYDDGVIHTERMPKLSPMCSVQSVTHVPCRSGPPQGTGSIADSSWRFGGRHDQVVFGVGEPSAGWGPRLSGVDCAQRDAAAVALATS